MRPDEIPAAHSMDTTWFAVDADGHVGMFESGEAGAVPLAAATSLGESDTNRIDGFVIEALCVARIAAKGGVELPRDEPESLGRMVVVLDDTQREATYRERGKPGSFESALRPDERAVLRESRPRVLMTTRKIVDDRLALLADDPEVRGVLGEYDLHTWIEEHDETGVFLWSQDDYEAVGHYQRHAAPADPIRLDELPTPERDAISKLRLDVRFAQATDVQLADHLARDEVATWGEHDSLRPLTDAERAERDRAYLETARARAARNQRNARVFVGAVIVAVVLAAVAWWLPR